MGLKTPEKRENTSSNENVFRGLYPVHTYFHFPLAQLFTFSSAYLLIYIFLCILIYIFSQHTYIFTFSLGIVIYISLWHIFTISLIAYVHILGVSLAYFLKLSLRLCTYIYSTVLYIVPLLPEVHFSLSIHFLIFTQPHTFIYIFIHKYFLYLKKKYLHFSLTIQMSTFFSLHIKHLICTF